MATIRTIDPIAVNGGSRNWVFVRVVTNDGLIGIGEATLELHTETVVSAIRELAPLLVGVEASRIQEAWQLGYRARFWRGGPVLVSALSGIEQALWDIKGKVAGLPVYELLGGACRDRLLLYANFPDGMTPDEMAADMQQTGLTGIKITPFHDSVLDVDSRATVLQRAIDETAAMRAAIGPSKRLAVDIHGRLSAAMSIVYAHAVEDLDIWFIEEPALPDDLAGLSRVAAKTTIPVATGERIHTRADFWKLLETGAVAMVQPDLAHCGGIFEGRTIAAMAEANNVGFAPHNPLSLVNTMASAHVSLSSPNFIALEHKQRDSGAGSGMITGGHQVVDGYLHVSTSPGLGIELDLKQCAMNPPLAKPVPNPRRADGSLSEW
jgi:galactonate dehydratase